MPPKLRILAFHGYTSNSFILHRRLGSVRKACRDVADIVTLNGPLLVQPISRSLDAPEGEDEVTEATPIEEQPRAWWKSTDEGSYKDVEKTWKLLSEELAKLDGPVDGVIGFSQGACLAGLLAAAFESPSLLPALKLPEGQGPLKFAIAISGFRSRDPEHQPLWKDEQGGIETPLLHILGKADQIVDEERSMTLVHAAKNSRVEHHAGGHVVPSQAPWRNFMRDYIASFQEGAEKDGWKNVLGPAARSGEDAGGEGDSAPPSGTATPTTTTSKRPGL
ncbi:hypothetical protein BDZ90DRAFT_229328 [Jaminaea rosea]|uniref:Serine hydrolase domain-containing protein n=1 Tax=Jaminaea rosea TaxID=1569628 RepID=A0A316UZX2_9BASI|nr:hypothetical protein BDZ90DRAFT_229328 [Jaminaea rosea]PWN30308.1 hypothetical protein BDZ90DRAFT_229328 [Jaminaea rosea]